eukprot:792309_1
MVHQRYILPCVLCVSICIELDQFHGDKVVPQYASLNASQWVGCDELLQRMTEIQDVKFHVFGHIHEGYGVTTNKKIKDTIFINPSTVNVRYQCVNRPIMFYVKGRGRNYCDVKSLVVEDQKENDDDDANEAQVANEDKNENVNAKPMDMD